MSTLMPDSITAPQFSGQPRPTWLWPLRIPFGKITLLAGDPGLGKSFIALDLAARLSTGSPMPHTNPLPQSRGTESLGSSPSNPEPSNPKPLAPASTLLLSAEDELHDTILPRLSALGADLSLIHPLRCLDAHQQYPQPFSLKEDLCEISQGIEEHNAQLVILDPITAFLAGIDLNSTSALRQYLTPLAQLAAFYGVAVLAITHLNKELRHHSLRRATGSLALSAIARTVHLVHPSPSRTHNLLTPIKSNLASNLQPLPFRITNNTVEWLPLAADLESRRPSTQDSELSTQDYFDSNEALTFLRESLASGPQPAIPLIRQAKQLAISERTLRRAKAILGIIAQKQGYQGQWVWLLPNQSHPTVNSPV